MDMKIIRNACRFMISCGLLFLFTTTLQASESHPLEPADTSSPRATLRSFQKIMGEYGDLLRTDMYMLKQGSVLREDYLDHKAASCMNLNNISKERINDVDDVAIVLLQEVLDRIELPPYEKVPDTTVVQNEKLSRWTIPKTEITIAKVEEDKRKGEWLFTQETVANIKNFYEIVKELPYRPDAVVGSIGPLGGLYTYRVFLPEESFPSEWLDHMPAWTRTVYLEHPVWKLLAIVLILVSSCLIFALILLLDRRIRAGRDDDETRVLWWKLVLPVGAIAIAFIADELIDEQIDALGVIDAVTETGLWIVILISSAWAILRLGDIVAHTISWSPKIQTKKEYAALIHLFFRVLSLIVGTWLVLEGLDRFGLSLFPLFAGLGVGGFAVALAVRPTLENLIGSIILMVDKPVSIGDFCRFDSPGGNQLGMVETIGLRSTRLRMREDTIVTIPNSEFSQLQLENLSSRDRTLMRATLALRYETTADQLRYVLAQLRKMMIGHPEVSVEGLWVRFKGFGDCSLDIEFFAYIRTTSYPKYRAIREDINLRIMDIVKDAGTGFAFPSQTAYLANDSGLDSEQTRRAEDQVTGWRSDGSLPFPEFEQLEEQQLADTLDYPPAGAPASQTDDLYSDDEQTQKGNESGVRSKKTKNWKWKRNRRP